MAAFYEASRAILQALGLAATPLIIDTETPPGTFSFWVGATDYTQDVFNVLSQASRYFSQNAQGQILVLINSLDPVVQQAYMLNILTQAIGFPAMVLPAATQVTDPQVVAGALPTVTGTPTNTSVMTCSQGTWTGTATITYTYQWLRDGVAIAGQTASTHTNVPADQTHLLSCAVTATNAYGSTTFVTTPAQLIS